MNEERYTSMLKPIWQLTCGEFLDILRKEIPAITGDTTRSPQHMCVGVHALAEYLCCSDSTVYALKRQGLLDGAVVSHVGRRIVFDGNLARDIVKKH